MNKEEAREALELIKIIKEISKITKINNTFLPAFEEKSIKDGETHWLHGSFRLGGTKSSRLSSANPNLQNLPSTGTKYAKPIKGCFKAPRGFLFVGADYNSLEDMISALTTRDPNKLRVYEDGFDGHSLRAYAYFQKQMPDIAEQLSKLNLPGKFYRVTHDDGTVEFCHESDLPTC